MRPSLAHACSLALPGRVLLVAALRLGLLLALAGCKDEGSGSSGPEVGTNSNWLRACSTSSECGELPLCECGACTQRCSTDTDCDGLVDATCLAEVSPSASQSCEGPGGGDASAAPPPAAPAVCLPRCELGSCGDGQACVSGGCVLAALPDNAFCVPVSTAHVVDRTREDDLLAQVNALRVAGGAVCGASGAVAPAPALRLDARLTCAARVLATDIARTRSYSLTDSAGRGTNARITATGYVAGRWGDGFAYDVSSAAQARQTLLAEDSSCLALTSTAFTDVGIGSSNDVLVVTFASP